MESFLLVLSLLDLTSRAQEIFEWLYVVVKGSEHHTATRGHFELVQAMLLHFEVFGHASVYFSVLLDTASKRHAL